MIHETVVSLYKKHVYSIYFEKFKNEVDEHFLERYVGKHALLKPNLIVVNDQLHGFKKVSEHIRSLEKFPIYLELEYLSDGEEMYVESVDLYSEASLQCGDRLDDVIRLANRYSKLVSLERVCRVGSIPEESLIVYSKIGDQFSAGGLELDLEDGSITPTELKLMLESYFVSFVQFIKLLDDVIVKGKPFKALDQTAATES